MSSTSPYQIAVLNAAGNENAIPHIANKYSEQPWLMKLIREQQEFVRFMRGLIVEVKAGEFSFCVWRVATERFAADPVIEAREQQQREQRRRRPRAEFVEAC